MADVFREFFKPIYQELLATEFQSERKIYKYFKDSKKESLRLFDKLMTKTLWRKLVKKYQVKNKSFNISVNVLQLGSDLQKASDPELDFISFVGSDELKEELDTLYHNTSKLGGTQVFQEFDIPINFRMDNQVVIDAALAYNLELANDIANQFSNDIKFSMIEGLKNGTSIPDLRDGILEVYNSGHVVNVAAKLDSAGNIVRKAYSYTIPADRYANIIARSEAIRWTAEGKLNAYEQTDVVQTVQLETAGDKRVCPICQAAEGAQYTLEDAHGVLPLHCLGRCTWICLVDLGRKKGVPGATTRAGEFFVTAVLIRDNIPKKVKQQAARNVALRLGLEDFEE